MVLMTSPPLDLWAVSVVGPAYVISMAWIGPGRGYPGITPVADRPLIDRALGRIALCVYPLLSMGFVVAAALDPERRWAGEIVWYLAFLGTVLRPAEAAHWRQTWPLLMAYGLLLAGWQFP